MLDTDMKVESVMRSGYSALAVVACLLFAPMAALSGTIPAGYEKLDWNSDFKLVQKRYPHGHSARLGAEVIYKQQRPNRWISRRNFAFREGKLHAVAVTFDKRYVEIRGIENILAEQQKQLGEGVMDRSQAPHMINCVWEGGGSRITFAYAPKRPDMTVIMYEQK